MNNLEKNKNKGFTLVETLVALFIFSTSVLAILSVTAQGVANTNFAKNKLAASFLAGEGIEMVRNIRDTCAQNTTNCAGWSDFISKFNGCNSVSGEVSEIFGCNIDPDSEEITHCSFSDGCGLTYDNVTGSYVESSGTDVIFTRKITLDSDPVSPEAKVISQVFWNQGQTKKNVLYSEDLYDWQEQ